MYELDKTNFANFLTEQRKAKGYTQKNLAEKLFVSDKAVSKWERSLSMPDISLLIPLAEILEVSVTELLEGRKLNPDSEMNAEKVEELVKKALTLSEENPGTRQQRKERLRKNAVIFCSCALIMILEAAAGIWLTNVLTPRTENTSAFMASLGGFISVSVLAGLSFFFGIYFWFFMKERLPLYYDENKISVYNDGIFNLSLPGINFNNNSWPHMVKALRIWSAVTMVTAPPVCLLPAFFSRLFPTAWLPFCLQMTDTALYVAGMFVPLYIIDNKYRNQTATAAYGADTAKNKTADGGMNVDENIKPAVRNRQIKRCIIFALLMLLLALLINVCKELSRNNLPVV